MVSRPDENFIGEGVNYQKLSTFIIGYSMIGILTVILRFNPAILTDRFGSISHFFISIGIFGLLFFLGIFNILDHDRRKKARDQYLNNPDLLPVLQTTGHSDAPGHDGSEEIYWMKDGRFNE